MAIKFLFNPFTQNFDMVDGVGSAVPSLTAGSVVFADGVTLSEDNANFFWDDTNDRLGLLTNTPSTTLDIGAAGTIRFRAFGDGVVVSNATGNLSIESPLSIAHGGTGAASSFAAGSVIFSNGTSLAEDVNQIFWDATNNRLGLGNGAPSTTLHVTGGARFTSLTAGVVVSDANGVVSSEQPLSVAHGGTGLAAALTNGSVLFSNGTTIAQDNANLFWDDSNNRLGIGNAAPSTALHVTGGARFTALTAGVVVSDANGVISSEQPLSIAHGGTGAGSFTANRILITDGSGNLTVDSMLTYNLSTNVLGLQGTLNLLGSVSGTTTLAVPAAAGTYTLTLPPAVSAADDLMLFNASGTATFGKIANINVAAAAAIAVNKLAAQTASRLASYDASGFLQANAALTSGRIPVASAAGALTDDAQLTYDTTTNILGLQGTLNILGSSSGTTSVTVPAAAGTYTLTLPPATAAADDVMVFTAASTGTFAKIVNANISSSAAIAVSKLATLTASRLVNTSAGGVLQVNAALTTNGVAYATASGTLAAGTVLTFDGSQLTNTTGNIEASSNAVQGAYVYSLQKGTTALPSIGCSLDKDTGFHFPSDNVVQITVGNSDKMQWDSTSLTLLAGYTLKLGGATSGTTTLAVPSVAGTYTLTLPNATASADDVMTFNGSSTGTFAKIANANVASGAAIAVNKLAAQTATRLASYDASGFLQANAALTANRIPYASSAGALTDNANISVVSTTANDELVRLGTSASGGIPAFAGLNIAAWGHQALHATLGFCIAHGSDGVVFFNSTATSPSMDFLSNFNTGAPNLRVQTGTVQIFDGVSTTVPVLTFIGDLNCGFNRAAADDIVAICAGATTLRTNATGTSVGGSSAPIGVFNIQSNSVEAFWLTGTVNTTDATQTTLITFTTASDVAYHLEADVVGRRTGGASGAAGDGAAYKILARAKNVAGTLTVSAITTALSVEDQAGFDATFTVSGTAIRVSVTGAASNNLTWDGLWKIVRV